MKTLKCKGVAILIAGALLSAASGAQAQPPPSLTVHTLKEGKLYWVEGGGGNSGVVIGDKGVVVIDAKTTEEGGRGLVAAIAKLTPKPITHLIETHSDGDHVNGVVAFPRDIGIIAHANNRNDQVVAPLQATVEVGGGRCIPPQDRLPNMIVDTERVSTTLDGERFEILYYGPSHTNGDLIVYLPTYKVVFTGDLLTGGVLIHPEKAGSFDGWFKTMRRLLQLGADTYVPGHAATTDTKAMLRQRIADNQAIRDKVDALVDQGKSLAEVKAAMGDPAKDSPGCRGFPYPTLTWIEYQDRTQKREQMK